MMYLSSSDDRRRDVQKLLTKILDIHQEEVRENETVVPLKFSVFLRMTGIDLVGHWAE